MSDVEEDVFEIEDFTTASDWERFTSRIEEVVHIDWKLSSPAKEAPLEKGDLSNYPWKRISERIEFANVPFIITYHYLAKPGTSQNVDAAKSKELEEETEDETAVAFPLQDMMSTGNEFSASPLLARWFGLRSYVLLQPEGEAILSLDRINSLLSSISIAMNNSRCRVPIFVQVLEKRRELCLGSFEQLGLHTRYEMAHLGNIPEKYRHLAGLLHVFKAKINSPADPASIVLASIRFTYRLTDPEEDFWANISPGDSNEAPPVGELPFGLAVDPVEQLYLFVTWNSVSEEVITESDIYSDLDPSQAPQWAVGVSVKENLFSYMNDSLREFANLCTYDGTFQSIHRNRPSSSSDTPDDYSQALERMTGQSPYAIPASITQATRNVPLPASATLSKVSQVVTQGSGLSPPAPIPQVLLQEMVKYIFHEDEPNTPKPAATSDENTKAQFSQFKTAPVGSLVSRLAVCLCHVTTFYQGLQGMSQLWGAFIIGLRSKWEEKQIISGMDRGAPNLGYGLLYQKIQMLNYCLEKRITREDFNPPADGSTQSFNSVSRSPSIVEGQRGRPSSSGSSTSRPRSSASLKTSSVTSSDDEFFECDNENGETGNGPKENQGQVSFDVGSEVMKDDDGADVKEKGSDVQEKIDSSSKTKKSVAEGQFKQCGTLTLVNSDTPLYIPMTQDPGPMTEDMLAQHADVLTKLGTSSEGSNLRAQLQSASLLSDMQSFKAANPGCTLEDFVRWYSPRDYVDEKCDESGNVLVPGELSERMKIPGNMWVEVWTEAKAVPARKQRRLFDDTKEAEKVLQFLSVLRPGQVALYLLPVLLQAAILRMKDEEVKEAHRLPSVQRLLDLVTTQLGRLSSSQSNQTADFYREPLRLLQQAEILLAKARSLQGRLQVAATGMTAAEKEKVAEFAWSLSEQREVNVVGASRGPVGRAVGTLLAPQVAVKPSAQGDISPTPSPRDGPPGEIGSPLKDSSFPSPISKEYILRTATQCPASYSRLCPQRMYCTIMKKEYRLAGAFTVDNTFV